MKKLWTFPVANTSGSQKLAQRIVTDHLEKEANFTLFLEGSLGAGKTFFVREILRLFGVDQDITSPTYVYVNEYKANNKSFAHFDLYRLPSPDDFLHKGLQEIAEDPTISSLVEWPDKSGPKGKVTFSGTHFTLQIKHGLGVGMRKVTLLQG